MQNTLQNKESTNIYKLSDLGEVKEIICDQEHKDFCKSVEENLLPNVLEEFIKEINSYEEDSIFSALRGPSSDQFIKVLKEQNYIYLIQNYLTREFLRFVIEPKHIILMHNRSYTRFKAIKSDGIKSKGFDDKKRGAAFDPKGYKVYQINLKSDLVRNDYLTIMNNSYLPIWHKHLKIRHSFHEVLKLNLKKISELIVRIPSIQEQDIVISNLENIQKINEKLSRYERNIKINPLDSIDDAKKINEIAKVTGSLSSKEIIDYLIEGGENDKVEFKSSYCHCVNKKTKESYLIDEIVKTVAGFLNTNGGDLLIGVADNKTILGVEEELETHFKSSQDRFKQAFSHTMETSYGTNIDEFISYNFEQVQGKLVFHVMCEQSTKAIFAKVKNKEVFYKRQDPKTIQLEGQKLIEYCNERFAKD